MALATSSSKPFRYSGTTPKQAARMPQNPPSLPLGKVLIVRGRTATQVYHLWRDCKQLRGFQRIVKHGFARAAGLRPCTVCAAPHQLTLDNLQAVPA